MRERVARLVQSVQSRTQTLDEMPDEIRGSGIILYRIQRIVVNGSDCLSSIDRNKMTNDVLFGSELECGLKEIGEEGFLLKEKQRGALQKMVVRGKTGYEISTN